MVGTILFILVFICFSAFFSASETAIFSLAPSRINRLKARFSNTKILIALLKKPSYLLCTIVFGNMLVNIGLASLTTAFFVKMFGRAGILYAILFSGVIILFFGEIFPKIFAIHMPERVAFLAAPPLQFFARVFSPVLAAVQRFSDYLSRFFIPSSKKEGGYTEDELRTALILGKREGQITEAEESLISCVLEFKDTSVSQIMTPRVDAYGIDIEASQEEVLDELKEIRHSKFPVYEKSLDNIRGILNAKDVFLNPTVEWKRFIRNALFIPESKKIDDLLKEFIEKRIRIAVIIDEYGGTSGLVTFEDIVEEIFGEIYDEYELPQPPVKTTGPNAYRVFGKTPIKTVNLELGLTLPEEEDTVAGFLLSKLERIPEVGERFVFYGVEFIIKRASRKKLVSIILRKKQ